MGVVFGLTGVCCLIYYGIIAVYSGTGTAFSGIWLVLAACSFLMALAAFLFPRFKERIPLRLEVAAVTVAAAFFAVFVIVEAAMAFQSISFGKPPNVNYMIVLGAKVQGDKMSRSLQ